MSRTRLRNILMVIGIMLFFDIGYNVIFDNEEKKGEQIVEESESTNVEIVIEEGGEGKKVLNEINPTAQGAEETEVQKETVETVEIEIESIQNMEPSSLNAESVEQSEAVIKTEEDPSLIGNHSNFSDKEKNEDAFYTFALNISNLTNSPKTADLYGGIGEKLDSSLIPVELSKKTNEEKGMYFVRKVFEEKNVRVMNLLKEDHKEKNSTYQAVVLYRDKALSDVIEVNLTDGKIVSTTLVKQEE